MILILEGAMGSGKSTLARALIDRHGFKGLRMFHTIRPGEENTHRSPGQGLDTGGVERFVPTNTWLEDIYAAEVMRQLKPERVLIDRSFISGVVWEHITDRPARCETYALPYLSVTPIRAMLGWWAGRMREAGGVLVHMAVPLDVALERCQQNGRHAAQGWTVPEMASKIQTEQSIIAALCDQASEFMPHVPLSGMMSEEEGGMVLACELFEELLNSSGGGSCQT